MKIKKVLRLIALVFFIVIASIIPVPITFYKKDNLPKHLIEQLETKKEDSEEDNIKELF